MNLHVDDTDRVVASQEIDVTSFSTSSPCWGKGVGLASATQTNHTKTWEFQSGSALINPATEFGIAFTAQDANCPVQKLVILTALVTDAAAATSLPYPPYYGDYPWAYANTLNIDWDTGGNKTQYLSVFAINIAYERSTVVQASIYNYCYNNITVTNDTAPVFARSLTG